jgi:hypothetical protein
MQGMFTLLASMGTKDTVWIGYYVIKTVSDISLSYLSSNSVRNNQFDVMRSLPPVLPKGSVFFFWWEAYSPSGNGKHRKCDPSILPMGSIESAILPFCQWEEWKVRSFRFANGKHRKCDPSVLPMGSIESAILPFCQWEASKERSFRFADGKHLPRPSNGMNGKAMTTVFDLDEISHSFGKKTETRFPYLFCEILLFSSIPQTC